MCYYVNTSKYIFDPECPSFPWQLLVTCSIHAWLFLGSNHYPVIVFFIMLKFLSFCWFRLVQRVMKNHHITLYSRPYILIFILYFFDSLFPSSLKKADIFCIGFSLMNVTLRQRKLRIYPLECLYSWSLHCPLSSWPTVLSFAQYFTMILIVLSTVNSLKIVSACIY